MMLEHREGDPAAFDRHALLLASLRPLLTQPRFSVASVEFLSILAQAFGCERISLGFIFGRAIKICAVSREYQKNTDLALPEVVAAMEEAVLQDATLVYPQPPSDFPHILAAHAELARRGHLSSVLTVPLAEQGQLIGAITLESQRSACFDTDRIALMEQLGAEAGPLLKLKWALDRPLLARCVTAVRQALSGKPGTSSRRAQVGAAALAALLAIAFAVLPLPHHVSGPARLEAMTQRVISAPVDGYLKQVHVRPGDRVTAQQVLAELNDEPLRTEHRRLTAEFMQHQNALADAMVKANRTQVMVHSAKLDELTAQIDLLEQQLQHTRLRAPFDGVVIKGDLTQMLGTPIKRSDVLLTLSQGTEFRVLVDVGERDIEDVKVGRRGTLVLAAHPAQPLAVQVVRVAPVANVTEEGQNAFEVEAAIESNVIPLAPGLKGSVKIESDARPFGWHWATRAWHALKYAIWSRL